MKAKAMSLGASMLVIALLLFPTGAYAQFGGIFSAILSTITGPIGGALADINQIRGSILKTEQQVLWPVTLIAQAQNYISTIKASYRGWMNQVYTLPVNSANLQWCLPECVCPASGTDGNATERCIPSRHGRCTSTGRDQEGNRTRCVCRARDGSRTEAKRSDRRLSARNSTDP
ncbi:MAG: hypothetical protein QOJ51_6346 [Acidobacteriaceae bacterium]|jgi:hypothetical protein|nr:hypothetical protein [Acidobacteriaceae bacterium]